MTIEFCAISNPEDWMEMVAEQFGTSVTDNGFAVPPSVGSGFFKQYYPLSWLTLTYISFVSYEPMTMVRRSVENSKWIPVMLCSISTRISTSRLSTQARKRSGWTRSTVSLCLQAISLRNGLSLPNDSMKTSH